MGESTGEPASCLEFDISAELLPGSEILWALLDESGTLVSWGFDNADGTQIHICMEVPSEAVSIRMGFGCSATDGSWETPIVHAPGVCGVVGPCQQLDVSNLDVCAEEATTGEATRECPELTFVATHIPVGDAPHFVTTADLDADGSADVIVSNRSSGDLSIFLNDGTGQFLVEEVIAVGPDPQQIATADFDGNGWLDIAVTQSAADQIAVLLGTAGGSFGAPAIVVATATQPLGLAAGDLDSNGTIDLVTTRLADAPENVHAFAGQGDGTFGTLVDLTAQNFPYAVAIADLDGELTPDLVVANDHSASSSVFYNTGGGAFSLATTYAAGIGPVDVEVADLDADGDLDFATVNHDNAGSVSIHLNAGDASFSDAVNYTAGDRPYAAVFEDFDGNGTLDLGTVNQFSQDVVILCGRGDGTFETPGPGFPVHAEPFFLDSADFDGDGDADLVAVNTASDDITILTNES